MLPTLYTLPKPTWNHVGPLMGTILEEGSLLSAAAVHLETCHDDKGPIIDTTLRPQIEHKTTCLAYWTDRSALIGKRTPDGIAWYPHPFTFTNPILEVPRRRLNTSPRKLTLALVSRYLTPQGPDDLVRVWDDTLKAAIEQWATHLGPVPETGAPGGTLPICPNFPFALLTQEEQQSLKNIFQDCFAILGNQQATTITLRGFRPHKGDWQRPQINFWKTTLSCEKETALAWLGTIMKNPNLPVPLLRLLQRPDDETPIISIHIPAASAHAKIEAYARLTQTLGASPPLPT